MGSYYILENYLWIECQTCHRFFIPLVLDAEGCIASLTECEACARVRLERGSDPPKAMIERDNARTV